MEPVFRTLDIAAKTLVAATGTEITYQNLQNIPSTGGAVIAINHTSYVDWLPAALAVHYRGRRIRYMIKAEMQQVKIVNFLIKHTKTIPVDRRAGHKAYDEAVRLLRAGEVVGLMPEATISRSFELKDFKTGAARMALDAGGTAVICNPMPLAAVKDVAAHGERVPRKSTSFGPKPRTGLGLRTFEP